MSIGALKNSINYAPYNRYLDVNDIKLLVMPEVSSNFPAKVSTIYKSMFLNNENIDLDLRNGLLTSIASNEIGPRIGYSGTDYYDSIGQPL